MTLPINKFECVFNISTLGLQCSNKLARQRLVQLIKVCLNNLIYDFLEKTYVNFGKSFSVPFILFYLVITLFLFNFFLYVNMKYCVSKIPKEMDIPIEGGNKIVDCSDSCNSREKKRGSKGFNGLKEKSIMGN